MALLFTCTFKHSILPDISTDDVNDNSVDVITHYNIPEAVTEGNVVDEDGPALLGEIPAEVPVEFDVV